MAVCHWPPGGIRRVIWAQADTGSIQEHIREAGLAPWWPRLSLEEQASEAPEADRNQTSRAHTRGTNGLNKSLSS